MAGTTISEELNVCFDPAGFRAEVAHELADEEAILAKIQRPSIEVTWQLLLAIGLIAISAVFIYYDRSVLYMWLIVGLLLYSYNFIILLLPTTTERARPGEKNMLLNKGRDDTWLAFRLLAKKRLLAIEIGLTIFLGGMVPLVLSFSIIFGLALFFTLFFAAFEHIIDWNFAIAISLQVVLILGFYFLMIQLEPESQGITRFARMMKGRYGEARTAGRMGLLMFLMAIASIIVVSTFLVVGAIILPGSTILTVLSKIGQLNILSLLVVVIIQLYILRYFQSLASRSMAYGLLETRTKRMRDEILPTMDQLMMRKDLDPTVFEEEFIKVRKMFYSQAIYDVIKVDLFGRAPVYLVGPRLKYVMDDKVLNHFQS